jgi:hypothetical protein
MFPVPTVEVEPAKAVTDDDVAIKAAKISAKGRSKNS